MEKRSYGMLVIAGLVALGAVGVALITTRFTTDPGLQPLAVVESSEKAVETGDFDGDGVPDWKEILWATDPKKSDTDGDGVGDLEEIQNETALLGEKSGANLKPYIAPTALPPSDAAARELFAGYTAALDDGSLTSSEISSVVSGVLERNATSNIEVARYALSDVRSGNVTLDTYRSDLLATLKSMSTIREYELTTFGKMIQTGDASGVAKLQNAAAVYHSTVSALLKLSVPDSVASEHLAALNSLSALASATESLAEWRGDPLEAMVRVDAFATAENDFTDAISELYSRIF